ARAAPPAGGHGPAAALMADGEAAPRRAQGEAAAQVIRLMAEALKSAGPQARELFVLSQLDTLVAQVAQKVQGLQIAQVQVVDGGDGHALPALSASFPQTVTAVMGALRERAGVDVQQMLGGAR